MDALSAASVIMGFNFAFSFVSIFRFYRRRAAKTAIDQRSALRPTLIISFSFLLGMISTAISFYSILTLPASPPSIFPPNYYPYDVTFFPWMLLAELAIPLFGFVLTIAVVDSIKQPRLYAVPALLLTTCYVLSFLSPKHPLDDPYLALWVGAVSLLLLIPMVLFGYLWRKTRRTTALGMFVGLILYYAYYLYYTLTISEYVGSLGLYYVGTEYLSHVERFNILASLMLVMIFAGVASLSLIYWLFQYSDRKLGGEVIGYTLTIPVVSVELFLILLSLGAVPIEYAANLLITAIAAGIFILTGSYVYGRYRESRSKQSLALSMFAYFGGLDFLFFAVMQNIYLIIGRQDWMNLVTLPVGILTGGFLFIAAMYAIDRPSLVLLPALVIAPLLIMELIFSPMPFWLLVLMAGAGASLTVVPGAMFGVLWRRMSKGKEKGRGRVFGIFLGFIFILFASPVLTMSAAVPDPVAFIGSYIGFIGAILALAGAFLFFCGISGRFDRWFYERKKK